MNVYEMEGFLRGKCMPRDILVNESTAEYLVRKLNEATTVKAERDALSERADALAVENANQRDWMNKCAELWDAGCDLDNLFGLMPENPATDAAIAAIEARGVEKFVTKVAESLRTAGGEDGYSLVNWGGEHG
ncbi:hypothetical protein [Serratia ficaria]|uniref:hypothetical protein n=1 Tax=Serratia ficaria TaxID=61651 RepID=UPI00077C46E3|nr:hypothetical protein [Serratia ficaria]